MASKGRKRGDSPVLATNRAASHEYHLLARYEAGIVLTGTEVKSVRAGRVNLKDAYARVKNGEVFLCNAHISPYAQGGRENQDPLRARKLLLHAREIRKLTRETDSGGITIVPTRLYLKSGRVKIEIALARGKRLYDKRDARRERDLDREMERERWTRRTG